VYVGNMSGLKWPKSPEGVDFNYEDDMEYAADGLYYDVEDDDENRPEFPISDDVRMASSKFEGYDDLTWAGMTPLQQALAELECFRDEELRKREGQRVDWDRVAEKAELDDEERQVLQFKLAEISRESAIALQSSPKMKLSLQAAWKRLDRKWNKVANALRKGPAVELPPQPPTVPADKPASSRSLSAIEVFRQHAARRTEKN
jgi:hypothetical protein